MHQHLENLLSEPVFSKWPMHDVTKSWMDIRSMQSAGWISGF